MSAIRKTGTFRGKSNKLGYGGRAAQLKVQGVPGGVIGMLARKAQAAPGQKNYHGGDKESSADSRAGDEPDQLSKRRIAMNRIVRHRAKAKAY